MEDQQFERGQGKLSAPGKHRVANIVVAPAKVVVKKQSVARRRKKRSGLTYVFFVIAVAYIGAVLAGGLVFGLSVRSALAHVETARAKAESLDFAASREEVMAARAQIITAEQGLFVLNLLKPIPYLGDQVRAVDSVVSVAKDGLDVVVYALNIGDDILKAADDLRSIIEKQDNFSFYDLPPETRTRILNAIAISSSNLQTMRVRTEIALDELAKIHEYNVAPQLLALITPVEELLPKMERSINFLIPVTSIVRELAGVGGDKQWLLLYLNNNEMRPAGGFIGVYGNLLMRNGEIVSLNVEDVMKADVLVQDNPKYQVAPPQPIRDYMGVSNWYFRDSNWSPDFETASDTAVQLLRQESSFGGVPVPSYSGVIGLTPTVAERILAYLGPITLEGQTFTSENVRQLLQEETQYAFLEHGLTVDQRKDLISKLTDEVVGRLIALPLSSLPDVIDIIMSSFEDKQMALRSYDEETQAAIVQAGWGSVVKAPESGDSLMVVDANMASLKTDPVVDHLVNYTITPQAGRLRARVDITYLHKGEFTKLVSRYRTFTRIFVPAGSELIRVDGSMKNDKLSNPNNEPGYVLTENDLGFTSFGTFTSVEPGRTQTLTFEYFLPDSIMDDLDANKYTLHVFKQMGAKNHALTLNLGFGKNVRTAEPAEARRDRGNDKYEWEGPLSTDQVVEVRF